ARISRTRIATDRPSFDENQGASDRTRSFSCPRPGASCGHEPEGQMTMRAMIASLLMGMLAMAAGPACAQPHKLTILLVGANGMIGSRVLAEAAGRGDHVIATSRQPDKIATGANIEPVKLDATDTPSFIALARRADVIVLATSPRGGGDPIAEEKAVADSAIATAKATGKRLMVVGGASSLNKPDGTP